MRGRPIPYKLSNGLWRVGFVNGEGKRQYLTGATARVVQDKLDDALAAVKQGLPATASSDRLTVYLERWLAGRQGTIKPHTWEGYESNLRLHVLPRVGRARLSLGPDQVQALYQGLIADGVGPYTVHAVHRTLRVAMQQAYEWRLVPRNVVKLVTPPKLPEKPLRVLDENQVRVFLEAIRGHRDEGIFVLAVTTGMRQSEISGLRWKDVDFRAGQLSLVQQRYRGEPGTLKTTAARRRLDLGTTALALLAELRTMRTHVGLDTETDYVFSMVQFHNINHQYRAILCSTGLPKIRFHDLRHTYATHMLRAGVPVHTVSHLLGHKDPAITLRVYAEHLPDDQAMAVKAVDSWSAPNA